MRRVGGGLREEIIRALPCANPHPALRATLRRKGEGSSLTYIPLVPPRKMISADTLSLNTAGRFSKNDTTPSSTSATAHAHKCRGCRPCGVPSGRRPPRAPDHRGSALPTPGAVYCRDLLCPRARGGTTVHQGHYFRNEAAGQLPAPETPGRCSTTPVLARCRRCAENQLEARFRHDAALGEHKASGRFPRQCGCPSPGHGDADTDGGTVHRGDHGFRHLKIRSVNDRRRRLGIAVIDLAVGEPLHRPRRASRSKVSAPEEVGAGRSRVHGNDAVSAGIAPGAAQIRSFSAIGFEIGAEMHRTLVDQNGLLQGSMPT